MKKNNILAIAAIALTFTACSNDNDFTTNNEGKDTPISLSVGVGDLSVVTRAGSNTTTPLTTGALGLYITKNGDKNIIDKYLCNNAKFTASTTDTGTSWTCNTTYYWASDNATINYFAYFPFLGTERTAATSLPWDTSTQTGVGGGGYDPLDLLYVNGSATNTANDHGIKITLGHVCSKLIVNVSKLGSEVDQSATVSSIKLGGIYPKGDFNLSGDNAGTWTVDENTTGDITMNKLGTQATGMNSTFESIIIPQTAAFSLTITLSNNTTYKLSIPSHTFEKGTCYTLTMQVGQDKVTIGNITQTLWEEVSGGPLTAQ